MNMMLISDALVIATFLLLISNAHLYTVQTQVIKSIIPPHSRYKKHIVAHASIAVTMLFCVLFYTALKIIDSVMQYSSVAEKSPMEYYLNASILFIGITLNMIVYHLRNEEDEAHDFYILRDMKND